MIIFPKLKRNWRHFGIDRRRQDKKPHVAALMVGCFDYGFSDFLHVALRHRNVRSFIFANNFKENRTLQAQTP
jgi:hypothetical protein